LQIDLQIEPIVPLPVMKVQSCSGAGAVEEQTELHVDWHSPWLPCCPAAFMHAWTQPAAFFAHAEAMLAAHDFAVVEHVMPKPVWLESCMPSLMAWQFGESSFGHWMVHGTPST
jgi:hypothetical protein